MELNKRLISLCQLNFSEKDVKKKKTLVGCNVLRGMRLFLFVINKS